jgi:catechol 2,3-dioxygenase-like lactoylglutathione lyase family enzyme
MPTVQRLQHVSVPMPAGGSAAAREFYGDALGLEEVTVPSALDGRAFVWFRAGPDAHEIHVFTDERFGPNSPAQHLCLQVDDIDAYRQQITARGVPIEETIQIHNRPRFFVRDPFGNLVELTQILGEYS